MERREHQRYPRFTKRLEVTFSSGGLSFRGILSNISANGLFIRTNRGFAPGSTVDIEVMLPDNTVSRLKGIVRRVVKITAALQKNGMGIELTTIDAPYMKLVKSFGLTGEELEAEKEKTAGQEEPVPDFEVIPCKVCGAKNKVPREKLSLGPRCGKCRTPLIPGMP